MTLSDFVDSHVSLICLNIVFVSEVSMTNRLMENEMVGGICPSCHVPFDKGKKRMLVDSCGHKRCYDCLFRNEVCPICDAGGNNNDYWIGFKVDYIDQ